MRDEHRPKHELIHEIAGLRKQVGDLRASRSFARLLSNDSPAELQAVGGVLGFFAPPEEQSRALGMIRGKDGASGRLS
jgi:hypothetical protein